MVLPELRCIVCGERESKLVGGALSKVYNTSQPVFMTTATMVTGLSAVPI